MTVRHKPWFNPLQDEEVLWYSNPSLIKQLPKFLFGLTIALLGIILPVYTYFFVDIPTVISQVLVLLTVVGVWYFVWEMLVFKNTFYVITNRRVIMKRGIIGRDTSSKPHREIVRVDVKVNTLDAIISKLTTENIGDMVVRTSDDSGEEFFMADLPEIGLAESFMERYSGSDLSNNPSLHGSSTPIEKVNHSGNEQNHQPQHTNQRQSPQPESPAVSDEPQQHSTDTPHNDTENKTDSSAPQATGESNEWDDLDEFEPSEYA